MRIFFDNKMQPTTSTQNINQTKHDPFVQLVELLIKIDKREQIIRKSDERKEDEQEDNQ